MSTMSPLPKYDELKYIETPGMPIDWRVEKMKLSKDKTQLKYNDFLMLDGIPAEAFGYRLGTRSALEWVVDQYRVKIDKRSGIRNDSESCGSAAVYCGFDWTCYLCEFEDGGNCCGVADIVGQFTEASRRIFSCQAVRGFVRFKILFLRETRNDKLDLT